MNFKQFSREGAREGKNFGAETTEHKNAYPKLAHYLPWCALITPRVLLQKAGYFQQVFRYQGPDTDTISHESLDVMCKKINNALHRCTTGWAITVEAQRLSCDSYMGDSWQNTGAFLVDLERALSFRSSGQQFINTYYISFVWKPPQEARSKAKHIFYESALNEQEADWQSLCNEFESRMAEMQLVLSSLFASLQVLEGSELLSYLHSTISYNKQQVAVPEVPFYLDALLADMPLEVGPCLKLGDFYMPVISITGFPPETVAAILDELNTLGIAYRWVTRFIALSDEDAEQVLSGYRRRFFGRRKKLGQLLSEEIHQEDTPLMDNRALLGLEEADEALMDLSSGQMGFGYYSCQLIVWDEDYDFAREKARELMRALRSAGMVCYEEGLGARDAWFASLPGNVHAGVRRYLMHTMNLVHLLPLSAPWSGAERSPHLGELSGNDRAHVMCSTPIATPFFLNLGVGDVGHCFIAGPTGAGKSTLLALLESQWLRYPGARVYIFDKDASALSVTLTHGGRCHFPAGAEAMVANGDGQASARQGFGLQPLLHIDDPHEKAWAKEFIEDLLSLSGITLDPEGSRELGLSLEHLAALPPEHRNLSALSELLQRSDYRIALEAYSRRGVYGELFDARAETELEESWIMFEMGYLMELGDKVLVPALSCIFHRLEAQMRRHIRPTLLVLDEAWLFLSHPLFADRIKLWLKTMRKFGVYVIFATQELSDALDAPIVHTIISACHSKIYLPDAEALTPAMKNLYASFRLSNEEIEILSYAEPRREYYYSSSQGKRLFSLALQPLSLKLLASRDTAYLKTLIGQAPEEVIIALLERSGGFDETIALVEKLKEDTTHRYKSTGGEL